VNVARVVSAIAVIHMLPRGVYLDVASWVIYVLVSHSFEMTGLIMSTPRSF
jgi:hypothetical protein